MKSITTLLLSLIFHIGLAHGGCLSVSDMFARIEGMHPGTPMKVRGLNGELYEGVVAEVFTTPNGRKLFRYYKSDGSRHALFLDELNPHSFTGPYESMAPGMDIAINSKSGNTYRGRFEGMVTDPSGKPVRILIRDETGKTLNLDIARLSEGSLFTSTPLRSSPLVNGEIIETVGERSYISFQANGANFRGSGRVNRITHTHGLVYVEVEEINPFTGQRTFRWLTADEIKNARLSANAKKNFDKFNQLAQQQAVAPRPAVIPAPQPVPVIKTSSQGSLQKPLTQLQRQQNTAEIFPKGSASHTVTGDQHKPILNPKSGQLDHFTFRQQDVQYAYKNGKIYDNVSPAQLPRGKKYTYVITEDGQVSYGMVDDALEYGVKHLHIARGRPVVAAGELAVGADGKLSYNLASGTFTQRMVNESKTTNAVLSNQVQAYFEGEVGAGNVQRVKNRDILHEFSGRPMTREEWWRICTSPGFDPANFSNFCQ